MSKSINDAKEGSYVREAEKWVERNGGTPPNGDVFPGMYQGMLDDYSDSGEDE